MRFKWRILLPVGLLVLGLCTAGCTSSKKQAREQAVARWQQVRTGVTLQMAQQQLQNGQPEKARDSLLDAVRTNPNDPPLHLLLGRVYFELGDLESAQAELTRAKNLGPDLAEVDYWQGVLAQATGRWDAAGAAYQAACLRAPGSAEYLCALLEAKMALGQAQEAFRLASDRLGAFPGDARLRLLAAGAAAQQADLAQAEDLYEQAIALDPSNSDAKEQLAQILYRAGKYARAAEILQGLLAEPGGGRRNLRPLLADCELACGQYDKARQLYETCLADDPDQVSWRLRLNEARLLSGQASAARQDLAALLARQADNPRGWELLGHACVLENDLPQARQAYERAARCGGDREHLKEFMDAIDPKAEAQAPAMANRGLDALAVTR